MRLEKSEGPPSSIVGKEFADMRREERGLERRELLVEISESERLRLSKTIVMISLGIDIPE